MTQLSIGGNLGIPDPTGWLPEGISKVGTYTDGAPLIQGLERGTLVWDALSFSDFTTLYFAAGASKAGTLPEESGSSLGTYDTVTSAYWNNPTGELRGGMYRNVRLYVTHIVRS